MIEPDAKFIEWAKKGNVLTMCALYDTEKQMTRSEVERGWLWSEVGISATWLNRLISFGLLRTTYVSRTKRRYRIKDRRLFLKFIRLAKQAIDEEKAVKEPVVSIIKGLPDFGDIQGYDDIKELIVMNIENSKPKKLVMEGPPASGKSLFLGAVAKWAGVPVLDASLTSKMGLAHWLIDNKPRYLVLDELDKMPGVDQDVLHLFLETGTVNVTKAGNAGVKHATWDCWSFIAWNDPEKVKPTIRSRLGRPLIFKRYTKAEFMKVGLFIAKRRKVPVKVAKQAIERAWDAGMDIRSVLQVFDYDTPAKMLRAMEIMNKYSKREE